MIPTKFRVHLPSTRELCQLDHKREIIPRDKQTIFRAEILVECTTDDKTIDLEFLLRTDVPFARLAGFDEKRDRTVSVGVALAKRGIPKLAKYSRLEIYGGESLPIPGDDTIPDESDTFSCELEEEIMEELAAQLREATARHRACTSHFEEAKDYLDRNTGSYRHEPARARSYAKFVADYMQNSSAPFMGAWNSEKSGALLTYVDDLIARKNTGHPGYVQAAEWISSTLCSVRPSKLWHTCPP